MICTEINVYLVLFGLNGIDQTFKGKITVIENKKFRTYNHAEKIDIKKKTNITN